MENNNQSSEGKTKNITLGLIIAWLYGIFVGIGAIVMVFDQIVPGLILLVSALIVFPPTYSLLSKKLHLSLSRSLKIVATVVLLVVAVIFLQTDKATSDGVVAGSNQNTQTSQQTEEAIKISAVKLSQEYDANKVAADAKYEDKLVEVTGIIDDIGKDILDTPYVTLEGPQNKLFGVQCMFSVADESKLAVLSKGQNVTLQGRVQGELIGNVIARGCKIIK